MSSRIASPAQRVQDHYYRVREVCDLTRMHERTIRQAIADGQLAVVRIGRNVLIDPDSLRRYLRNGQGR